MMRHAALTLLMCLGACWPSSSARSLTAEGHVRFQLPTFLDLARVSGTDKVQKHQYHHLYERYVPHYRHLPVVVLEIGLGCMNHPFGASLPLWRKFFTHPEAKVHFIEFNPACKEIFAHGANNVYGNIFLGDQSNVTFLEEVIKTLGGDHSIDIVIDDGSHNAYHQQISYRALWRAVKSPGVYVIEDLEDPKFVLPFVHSLIAERYHNETTDILSVDLFKESIAISKLAAADQNRKGRR